MPDTQDSAFAGLGLTPRLVSLLNKLGFVTPTPIQERSIPLGLTGCDLIGIAQTGTGKTLAFGLPLIERIHAGKVRRALILAPTRELALQIEESLMKVAKTVGMRSVVLIGGASMGKQVSQLRTRPAIIIATPGRLIDHLDQRTLTLREVDCLVLDEADRMLDMGFLPAIKKILENVPVERQTLLFSATMPKEIADLTQRFMNDPKRVEVERQGTTTELVTQELALVEKEAKNSLLERLLKENTGTVLVFSRTRHGAKKIARSVRLMGHASAELHSDRTLAQRRAALDGFKKGEYRVLVATDIAARGIDVKGITLVVNYDLPDNPEDYVHRIGRTGRAGSKGVAITFATYEQAKDVRDIERLIQMEITRAHGTPADFALALPPRSAQAAARNAGGGNHGGGGGARGKSRPPHGGNGPGRPFTGGPKRRFESRPKATS